MSAKGTFVIRLMFAHKIILINKQHRSLLIVQLNHFSLRTNRMCSKQDFEMVDGTADAEFAVDAGGLYSARNNAATELFG